MRYQPSTLARRPSEDEREFAGPSLSPRARARLALGTFAIFLLAATCGGDEKSDQVKTSAENASEKKRDENNPQRTQLLQQMRGLAQRTKVEFAKGSHRVELVKEPIFRYDDQPRRFIDATMWAWTEEGRPIAFQKIEATEYGDQRSPSSWWQYCFASLSSDLIVVEWPGDRRFRSSEPGVVFRPLDEAPAVASGNMQRRRQARELARKFSARILTSPKNNTTQEMRLLTTPLFEYADPRTKELRGAVYGLSTNGTNPDVLIVLEIRDEKEKPAWRFAPARMTTGAVTLRYADAKVWECEWINKPADESLKTWAFFATPRTPARDE